jgi:hypothetical protein
LEDGLEDTDMAGVIHLYDDDAGMLYLDDGREVSVNARLFSSVEQAVRDLDRWAKLKN